MNEGYGCIASAFMLFSAVVQKEPLHAIILFDWYDSGQVSGASGGQISLMWVQAADFLGDDACVQSLSCQAAVWLFECDENLDLVRRRSRV